MIKVIKITTSVLTLLGCISWCGTTVACPAKVTNGSAFSFSCIVSSEQEVTIAAGATKTLSIKQGNLDTTWACKPVCYDGDGAPTCVDGGGGFNFQINTNGGSSCQSYAQPLWGFPIKSQCTGPDDDNPVNSYMETSGTDLDFTVTPTACQ